MRSRNGWTDDGTPLRGSTTRCPNCGSDEYRETLSLEECRKCGLRCDYWGGGANEVYEAMMNAQHAEERERAEQRAREEDEY